MPINYKEYPANWKDLREQVLKRANNKCEFCGIDNYTQKPIKKGQKRHTMVVLTIAHLDHDKTNHDVKIERLRALCQKCHLQYDLPRPINNRKYGRNYKDGQGELF